MDREISQRLLNMGNAEFLVEIEKLLTHLPRDVKDSYLKQLIESENTAFDPVNKEMRLKKQDENIFTVFKTGKVIQGCDKKGIQFLIPNGFTMVFIPKKKDIKFVTPRSAEDNDDKNPSVFFFVDGVGVKRDGYIIKYAKKNEPMLYVHLSTLIAN